MLFVVCSKRSGVKWKGHMVVCSTLPPRHDWWGVLKTACVFELAHPLVFLCVRTELDMIRAPSERAVKAWCVQSDSMLALRRSGLVVSSIWEGTARHSPCLPCASALLCTLCCCCMRWTPKREWNGRFGAQVAENLSFRIGPPLPRWAILCFVFKWMSSTRRIINNPCRVYVVCVEDVQ